MKEHPVIFTGESVRGIISGVKTQTRRIVKPQPCSGIRQSPMARGGLEDGHGRVIRIKYESGQILWVRETWSRWGRGIAYRADDNLSGIKWKSPLFMPRWASRITLEIKDVRVERLWEITEEDAIAEGFADDPNPPWKTSPRRLFETGWNAINGKKFRWTLNCWVWVIAFRRIP